jgi:hypothetical protein
MMLASLSHSQRQRVWGQAQHEASRRQGYRRPLTRDGLSRLSGAAQLIN